MATFRLIRLKKRDYVSKEKLWNSYEKLSRKILHRPFQKNTASLKFTLKHKKVQCWGILFWFSIEYRISLTTELRD